MIKLKNRTIKVSTFILLIFIMLQTTVFGVSLNTEFKNEELIDIEVEDAFEKDSDVRVIIKLKDNLNIEKTVNRAIKSQSRRALTLDEEKELRGEVVVSSLKKNADRTQKDILDYLEEEMAYGNVSDIDSYFIVNAISARVNSEVLEDLKYRDDIEKIYLDKFVSLEDVSERKYRQKISRADDQIEWNIKRVNAPEIWELGYTGKGIVIGVIDSGVDYKHPALIEKWRGFNGGQFITDGNWYDAVDDSLYGRSGLPKDDDGHGTHVTGIILGQEPNGNNKIGVAPDAQWIAARALTAQGGYNSWLLKSGEWMLAPGGDPSKAPHIINNSWGGGNRVDDWYKEMVNNWRRAGIFPVFAAGNQRRGEPAPWPGSIENPSNYVESFAVAAVDIENRLGSFSKLGPSPYDPKRIKPDISAPGVDIRSSVPGGGYEGGWDGTSMAAPHVSGVIALLLDANGEKIAVEAIESTLKSTATGLTDKKYPESPNFGYGYGLVDASRVIGSLSEKPKIENIKIESNKNLKSGDIFKLSFNGYKDGRSFIRFIDSDGESYRGDVEEMIPGRYTSMWQIPFNFDSDYLELELVYKNKYGVQISQKLDERIKLNK